MRRTSWVILIALLVLVACSRGSSSNGAGLLQGLSAVDDQGIKRPGVLNDGELVPDGGFWDTDRTAVFNSRGAFIVYDLGAPRQIAAAMIQADHNDEYLISISDDGKRYRPLWRAPAVGGNGVQTRYTDELADTGRFIRLQGRDGDGAYSVSELSLYEQVPSPFPPELRARAGLPEGERVRAALLLFGLALGAFVLLAYQGAPLWWLSLLLVFPVFSGVRLVEAMVEGWPLEAGAVSMVRAMTALVATLAVLREAFAPRRFIASGRAVIFTLTVCAGLALAAFYNMGYPQFHDAGKGRPTFVHSFDLRVYFPVAKYFPELRFDGVYLASVAAYAEDVEGETLDSLGGATFRDLRTHRMTRVADSRDRIEEVKARFSPERWRSFKRDMGYFRELMGREKYLRSMHDHGGNATPVWTAMAYLLFSGLEANDTNLILTGLLDPILLLLAFAAIGRAFGLRTMLVCMVVFGANDFYMFFSNWTGATLRHDWMAYLAMGIALLKLRRFALGGALLALASLIRAFPALALATLGVPFLFWLATYVYKHRRLPGLSRLRSEQQGFLRVVVGAVLCVVVFVGLSVVVFDFAAWGEWMHKVTLLERGAHTNHISLRGLIAGAEGNQSQLLAARLPVFLVLAGLYVAMVVALASRAALHRAAVLGLVLIPVLFNPANYYIHFVFMLPLLANEAPRKDGARPPLGPLDAGIWVSLLVMCFALYWTVLEANVGLHFQFATAVFFGNLTVALLLVLRRDLLAGRLVVDTGALALTGPLAGVEAPGQAEAPAPEAQEQAEALAPGQAEAPAPGQAEAPAPEAPAREQAEVPAPEAPAREQAGAPAPEAPAREQAEVPAPEAEAPEAQAGTPEEASAPAAGRDEPSDDERS